MNKWSKISLACVPFTLLTVLNETTLQIGGSGGILTIIRIIAHTHQAKGGLSMNFRSYCLHT
ncbi:hypothetical protein CN571_15095 [Bacillus pseudomycoides]|uniref:Uncharacterized protein n=1 Tax=Bacillus pseudomycoides TaxID=64104 RepID=A0ABD6T7U1_9BACI|nr:hypothetical protein DJ94_5065 [Bacillus pseudomycoides]MDR4189068.1 hypothetical protein [Bacillus pseudomycoides]PEF22791.1 hypothetical protein CON69_20655 [Bacillus pseudomycoides]PEO88824.1 hypothetical protein CN571_15095 [Bacillus pseudomycoides]PEP71741.1 hypothetical protein CN584_29960 [Bacillus pseudomycoides]